MNKREIKFIISGIFPFNKLKEKEIEDFISLGEVKEYKNAEFVYREADPPDYFYLLLSGRILALSREDDKESEIELLKRGTCFGMISLFTEDPHSVTTKSIEASFVLRVEKEKFREFLNKHPLLSLDFSRILSERVKRRFSPKKIFKCKRIAILGFRSKDVASYLYNLGVKLKKQARKEVISIEVSENDDFSLVSLTNKGAEPLILSEFKEEEFKSYIISADIDYLLVRLDKENNLASLLNFLSESYHFILYKISPYLLEKHFKEVGSLAHYFHFLLSPFDEELKKGKVIIDELKKKDPLNQDRVQVIFHDYEKLDRVSFKEKKDYLNHPIYATAPKGKDYNKMIRRVARDIAEVVVGVALGGGGAFSFSHFGVLKVLEENGVYIDALAGTSVGALIAALWAAGFNHDKIKETLYEFGKRLGSFSFYGLSFPFKGLLRAKRLEGFLKRVFKDLTFYDLKCTLRIPVFDFLKRESRALCEGPIYKAVAASCAYPGIFEPVRFNKDILLDGGILEPLPTKTLFNYGAHKIIAVNITPSREETVSKDKAVKSLHLFDFIFGSVETMQREFIRQAAKFADLVIHPNMEGLGWMEFEKMEDFIRRGEAAAEDILSDIKKLIAF